MFKINDIVVITYCEDCSTELLEGVSMYSCIGRTAKITDMDDRGSYTLNFLDNENEIDESSYGEHHIRKASEQEERIFRFVYAVKAKGEKE